VNPLWVNFAVRRDIAEQANKDVNHQKLMTAFREELSDKRQAISSTDMMIQSEPWGHTAPVVYFKLSEEFKFSLLFEDCSTLQVRPQNPSDSSHFLRRSSVPSLEYGLTFWFEECWLMSHMWKVIVKPGIELVLKGQPPSTIHPPPPPPTP
jgi:hypothetical protein